MSEIIIISGLFALVLVVFYLQSNVNRKRLEKEIEQFKVNEDSQREKLTKAEQLKEINQHQSHEIENLKNQLNEKQEENAEKGITLAESAKDIEVFKHKTEELLADKQTLLDAELKQKQTVDDLQSKLIEVEKVIKEKEHEYKILENTKEIVDNDAKKLVTQVNALTIKNEELEKERNELKVENSSYMANLQAKDENHKKFKEDFEENNKKFELKVGEIMQEALDGKLKKFDESSMKSLDEKLKPFNHNLELFRKKIEESQEASSKKFTELSKEIEHVSKAGISISQEAENLTKALKGKKQTQGSWGEMILETVLEYSGLLKNVHYETQQSFKDDDGNTKRPDVVIKLPQDRTMIIDSKVSLNDYDRYIRSETDEDRLVASKAVAKAFKDQIDNLDSKDYSHYKIGTLQYVFMFVPIEGAFSLAIQEDPSLYEYALKKHIAIVNPSTLTVSLRTIYLYWQSEQSNSLAEKLFTEAGKLYDKMYNFADDFAKIGTQLQTVNKTYNTAHKKLSEGSGNLLGKVDNLKTLGARTSKSLKDSKIEYQDFNADEAEVMIEHAVV